MATLKEAADHIDLSQREFRELLDLGVIERKVDNAGYDLKDVWLTLPTFAASSPALLLRREVCLREEKDDGDDR